MACRGAATSAAREASHIRRASDALTERVIRDARFARGGGDRADLRRERRELLPPLPHAAMLLHDIRGREPPTPCREWRRLDTFTDTVCYQLCVPCKYFKCSKYSNVNNHAIYMSCACCMVWMRMRRAVPWSVVRSARMLRFSVGPEPGTRERGGV